jgi:hypothetical protein
MRRYSAALAILLLLCLAPIAQAQDQRCFPETGQCISGRTRQFWEQNGGLPVFGFPTTDQHQEQIEGKPFQVQWFERNRLELHPENARPYDVLLGRLGVDRLAQQGRDWFTFSKGGEQPGCRHFAETGHTLCGAFLSYFRSHGLDLGQPKITEAESLALFGLPISEMSLETNASGASVQTQWFERARFELHPENQPPYDVLLGLLGNEIRTNTTPPAPQPPPPGQTPLPPSVNATARPEHGPRGTRFFFTARGFKAGEKIGVYVTLPDQGVFGAPFQTTADGNGVSDSVSFQPPEDPDVPTGIWAITFEGIDSHNKAIAYFEVTDTAAAPPQPQPPAPPAPQPLPPSYNNCQADPNAAAAPNAPVRIVTVDKVAEVVRLQNVSGTMVNLDGWKMCSITGNQLHEGIGGTLAAGETKDFPHTNPGNIWNNSQRDDGALYNANGQLVSYWTDS